MKNQSTTLIHNWKERYMPSWVTHCAICKKDFKHGAFGVIEGCEHHRLNTKQYHLNALAVGIMIYAPKEEQKQLFDTLKANLNQEQLSKTRKHLSIFLSIQKNIHYEKTHSFSNIY